MEREYAEGFVDFRNVRVFLTLTYPSGPLPREEELTSLFNVLHGMGLTITIQPMQEVEA